MQGEAQQQQRGDAERDPGPRRPAVLSALDERKHDRGQPGGEQHVPTRSSAAGARERDSGTNRGAARAPAIADGHVDQKAGAPAEPAMSAWISTAADQLPAGGGQAHHEPVDAERARQVAPAVGHVDDRQHVGHHQRRADALGQPRGHQHRRGGGGAAGGRRHREHAQADREHAPAADPVPESRGGDQEHGRGQGESGDDPFDRAAAGVQVALHRGQRDVDDEEVEDDHEGPCQEHRERRPTVGLRPVVQRSPPDGDVDELDCVVMSATVTPGMRTVDYPAGNGHYLGGKRPRGGDLQADGAARPDRGRRRMWSVREMPRSRAFAANGRSCRSR